MMVSDDGMGKSYLRGFIWGGDVGMGSLNWIADDKRLGELPSHVEGS